MAQRQQIGAIPRPMSPARPLPSRPVPQRASPLRLYAINPLLVGRLAAWPAHFAHAAAMGFDAVVVAPVFRPIAGADLFRIADHDHAHPLFDAGTDADGVLAGLTATARREGLDFFLDVELGRAAEGSALARSLPASFAAAKPHEVRDPRRPPHDRGMVAACWRDPTPAAALHDWWAERLRRWQTAGVAGFRCLSPASLPTAEWQAITGQLPDTRFLAWLPGTDRASAAELAEAGFAGVFDSTAWWDCRAGWYADHLDALGAIAPRLATIEPPFGPRLAARFARPNAATAARRQLALGALAAGLVVPMGFEFGARRPLDAAADRPDDWAALRADPPADLTRDIRALNAVLATGSPAADPGADPRADPGARTIMPVTGPDAPVLAFRQVGSGRILALNPDLHAPAPFLGASLTTEARLQDLRVVLGGGGTIAPETLMTLAPGEARLLQGSTPTPIIRAAAPVGPAAVEPRVAIEAVAPAVDAGRFAVKRTVGELVEVTADIVCDGHDKLAGVVRWRPADLPEWQEVPLHPLGNDAWGAAFPLARLGRHLFVVEAWVDQFASFRHGLDAKVAAGQAVGLELEEGRLLVAAAAAADPWLETLAADLRAAADPERLVLLRAPETAARMAAADRRPHRASSAEMPVDADRLAARFASWYELFPRSQSGDEARHGTFADVIAQLPRVRAMGFDVLYFPPIHPIGRAFRKGRNNSLTPTPDDPGSPYAIGGEAGGHDAIHPELGTLEDFRRLRDAAAAQGMELALDFAVQCSPDHPWLREHRDWFAWRPDGSLRYAENPPKKYQDIVNVDFHTPAAIPDLWLALRDVVRFWAQEGVRLFRVDNPHTKPLPFWEWLIADLRATDPDIEFLAEAFTRPKVMYRLAKLGFGQSYTYFTWRNEKREIIEYLEELTTTAPRDFFRPHFFVNTPDINPVFLQGSGRPGFLIRAALATTLSGLWGMYQGFEYCEARALPGREEYLDSEKYQIRVWPDRAPGDIVDEVARLNAIRRGNPALHDHLGIAFHPADNDRVLWYRKRNSDGTNVLLIAVSLDPHAVQETMVEVPLWEWGLPDDATLQVEELMRGGGAAWRGKRQRLRLEPAAPFAIWRARPEGPFRPHLPPVAAAPASTGHH